MMLLIQRSQQPPGKSQPDEKELPPQVRRRSALLFSQGRFLMQTLDVF